MQLRLIEKDAKDLPANFAVAEGKTVAEGIASVRAAFNRPGVNLVVWNDAADLVAPAHKKIIASIAGRQDPGLSIKETRDSIRAFNALAALVGGVGVHEAITAWKETSKEIDLVLEKNYGHLRQERFDLRFTATEKEAGFHLDTQHDRRIVTLRTVAGDSTIFAGDDDAFLYQGERGMGTVHILPETQTLWHVAPWSVCFQASPSLEQGVAHSSPYAGLPGPAGTPRALEFNVLMTSTPVVPPRLPSQRQRLPRIPRP